MGKIIAFIVSKTNRLMKPIYMSIFSEHQRQEIKLGLVEKLDVNYYAKRYFDEKQMREIRYGLEEGLDVKQYAKRYYNSNQMREIRLNLENFNEV